MPTAANTNFNANPPRSNRKLEPDDPKLYDTFVEYGGASGTSTEAYLKEKSGKYNTPKWPSGKNP